MVGVGREGNDSVKMEATAMRIVPHALPLSKLTISADPSKYGTSRTIKSSDE